RSPTRRAKTSIPARPCSGRLLQPFPGDLGGPADGCGERPRELIFGERFDGSLLVGARPIRVRASLDLHGDFLVRHRVGAVQADASQRVCLVLLGRSLGTAVGSELRSVGIYVDDGEMAVALEYRQARPMGA